MDFNSYYKNQSQGLPGYTSPNFQRGFGVGSFFKKFFRWVIPIIKENATPLLGKTLKTVKNEISTGIENFQKDLDDENKSIKGSVKERIDETFQNLKNKLQSGKGKKKRLIKKNIKTIFD